MRVPRLRRLDLRQTPRERRGRRPDRRRSVALRHHRRAHPHPHVDPDPEGRLRPAHDDGPGGPHAQPQRPQPGVPAVRDGGLRGLHQLHRESRGVEQPGQRQRLGTVAAQVAAENDTQWGNA